jgi:hypothetical protein
MKFDLKSCLVLTSVLGSFFLACGTSNKLPTGNDEVSLKADRSSLDELRKEVPEEKKKENDELALILQVMNAKDKKPYEIREKFNTIMRKKREEFSKGQRRTRDEFTKRERAEREKFTKDQKEISDRFYRYKASSEERRNFSQEHNSRQQQYYSDSKSRRQAFEDDMRSREKDFSALVQEKNKEFEEHFKAYSKEYKEKMDLEAAKKKAAEADKKNKTEIPDVPAERLKTSD